MKLKLIRQAERGYEGWDDEEFHETGQCMARIQGRVDDMAKRGSKQEIDIANYCLFRWAYREMK